MNLYKSNSSTGLSIVPKLKYEHVYLTSFSKMRVDLAAEVCAYVHLSTHMYIACVCNMNCVGVLGIELNCC